MSCEDTQQRKASERSSARSNIDRISITCQSKGKFLLIGNKLSFPYPKIEFGQEIAENLFHGSFEQDLVAHLETLTDDGAIERAEALFWLARYRAMYITVSFHENKIIPTGDISDAIEDVLTPLRESFMILVHEQGKHVIDISTVNLYFDVQCLMSTVHASVLAHGITQLLEDIQQTAGLFEDVGDATITEHMHAMVTDPNQQAMVLATTVEREVVSFWALLSSAPTMLMKQKATNDMVSSIQQMVITLYSLYEKVDRPMKDKVYGAILMGLRVVTFFQNCPDELETT